MSITTMTAYDKLLLDFKPRPIRTERAYKRAMKQIEALMIKPHLPRAESEMLEVLATLVEQYESIEHPTPETTPAEMLAHLIEAREVSQAELARATSIPASTISAILSGDRQISKANVGRFARYFRVSPSLFLTGSATRQTSCP